MNQGATSATILTSREPTNGVAVEVARLRHLKNTRPGERADLRGQAPFQHEHADACGDLSPHGATLAAVGSTAPPADLPPVPGTLAALVHRAEANVSLAEGVLCLAEAHLRNVDASIATIRAKALGLGLPIGKAPRGVHHVQGGLAVGHGRAQGTPGGETGRPELHPALLALAEFVREVVHESATPDATEWVDQHESVLGKRRHLELVRAGALPGAKRGRRVFVRRSDIEAYIAGGRVAAAPPAPKVSDVDEELRGLGFEVPDER